MIRRGKYIDRLHAGDDKKSRKKFYQIIIANAKAKLRDELAAIQAELAAIAAGYARAAQPLYLTA